MTKEKYEFWLSYRRGEIDRELTEEEKKEVRASDFAAEILVPNGALLDLITKIPVGPSQLLVMQMRGSTVVRQLADFFEVEEEIVEIRLRLLANQIWSSM